MMDWLFYEIPLWWALAGGVGYLVAANLVIYIWCALRGSDPTNYRPCDDCGYRSVMGGRCSCHLFRLDPDERHEASWRTRRDNKAGDNRKPPDNRPRPAPGAAHTRQSRYRRDDMTTAAILGGAIAGTEGSSSSSGSSDGGGGSSGGGGGGGGGE